MSLSTYYLEYGRHLARLHRCRHRHRHRHTYAPTNNTASHDHHEKINSWVSFSFLYEYGAPLGNPRSRRSSAMIIEWQVTQQVECTLNLPLRSRISSVFPV